MALVQKMDIPIADAEMKRQSAYRCAAAPFVLDRRGAGDDDSRRFFAANIIGRLYRADAHHRLCGVMIINEACNADHIGPRRERSRLRRWIAINSMMANSYQHENTLLERDAVEAHLPINIMLERNMRLSNSGPHLLAGVRM